MIAQESMDTAKLLRAKLSELGFDPLLLSQEQIDWLMSVIASHKDGEL